MRRAHARPAGKLPDRFVFETLEPRLLLSATNPLWLSTDADVVTGGQPGTDTWNSGDLVQVADPNLAFEPGTTDGTFSVPFDADLFSAGVQVNAAHYVSIDIQVGASNFQLKAGDLLLSTAGGSDTFTSASTPTDPGFTNNLTVGKSDVFVFRPDTPGDYSAGTFAMLLDTPTGGGQNIQGISLIEQNTTVGDTTLQAGDFLYTRNGGTQSNDVWLFETTDVGAANTSGTNSVLLEGGDANISIGSALFGVDLVEISSTIGGQTLDPGTILLSVDAADTIGSNNLAVTKFDVFALDVTQTTLISGGGNGAATASLFFEGGDVAFDTNAELLDGFTLTVVNNKAPVLAPAATPTLSAVGEDAGAPVGAVGTLISNLIDFPAGGGLDNVTDADNGAVTGIAVTAADTTHGTWHYSIDGGTNWNPLGAVTNNNARLLLANANTRIYFQPNAAYNGTVSPGITFRAWDQTSGVNGGTADTTTNGGLTAFSSATDTADITVTAQNDSPTATITPASYAVTENTPLNLHGTGLSVADPDAAAAAVRATLAVGEGALSIAAGTSGVTVTNSGTSSVTLDGTLAQLNNLLAGNLGATIAYQALDAPSASTTLTLTLNDLGNTGTGGALSANDTATLNITAQNDSPTATITPASYAVTENSPLTLHGTGLSVADPDAAAAAVRATLAVAEGNLSISPGTSGVTVTNSGTNSVTLDGTLSQLNNLLAGNLGATIAYQALDAPSASTTLTLTVNDLGNTGTGGVLSANDTATLTITAQNDSPSATITPASYTVTENTPLSLHGSGLTVTDPDAGSTAVRATLAVGEGSLSVSAGTSGVTVTNSGTSTVTLDGTLSQLNNLLAGNLGATVAYQALAAPSATTTLTLSVNDQGHSGTGGALSATDTATLTIQIPLNVEAPSVTVPVTPSTPEPERPDSVPTPQPDSDTTEQSTESEPGETEPVASPTEPEVEDTPDSEMTQIPIPPPDLEDTETANPTPEADSTSTEPTNQAAASTSKETPQGPKETSNRSEPSPNAVVLDIPQEPATTLTSSVSNNRAPQTVTNNTDSQENAQVNASASPSRSTVQPSNLTAPKALTLNLTWTATREDEATGPKDTEASRRERDAQSSAGEDQGLVQELARLRDEIRQDAAVDKTITGSSLAVTTGLSISYLVWLMRGGMLLSSLLSSLPAWSMIDPLPVLSSMHKGGVPGQEDDDSLDAVIRKGTAKTTSKRRFTTPRHSRFKGL